LSTVNVNNTNLIELSSELSEDVVREEQQRDDILRKLRRIMDGENISVNKNSKLWQFTNRLDHWR
jgi:hypothetical protein